MNQYHEELSSKVWSMPKHYIPQNIFFWKLWGIIRPLPCWQQDLYFWQVLESIHKFIIWLHALQCLFLRGFNKRQRRGRIISSLGVISQRGPPSCTLQKKAFLSSSVWPRTEYTWTLNWKEGLLICFGNCQSVSYSDRQSRNRMMNTFIIVNITPTCKN